MFQLGWHSLFLYTQKVKSLEQVLSEYDVGGVCGTVQLTGGIIHKTWRIETDSGIFVLQKVNPIYTPAVMDDLQSVFSHLKNLGQRVAEVVKTKSGDLYVADEVGFWRLSPFIDGATHEEITSTQTAHEAAKLLGSVHLSLSDFEYEFTHIRGIKNNIPALFDAYKKSVEKNTNQEIAEMIPFVDKMVELCLPVHLRKTVNHGDPKISNFIFNRDAPSALVMVDFDDCGKNYNVLYELGSMLRSFSWDQKDTEEPFNLDYFEAALVGYCEGSKDFLLDEEWDLIPRALKLNLLQLVSRFIRDYFEDSYFEWDPAKYSSRKEHNLARAKEHLQFYFDIEKKEKEMFNRMEKIKATQK